jgi:ClpP class serine protease
MYDNFKKRVCAGRGISEEVIEEIAGGRVMTGLKAFEMVAPKELVRQIKGIEEEEVTVQEEVLLPAVERKEDVLPAAAVDDLAVAVLPEGEEHSPFAVPAVVEACAPSTSSSSPSPAATSTEVVKSSSTADNSHAPAGAVNGAAGLYEYDASGPYGRGLVDGLGGLRDAAIYACQVFVRFFLLSRRLLPLPRRS